ncbi:2OG-Fe(II) oxygenase family enzyme [Cystobacter fuscus DSM 2262]|uniref:2OG-Fe(II) oxygenase family enzyme n=1 Tax=Cystobacter fuscus (strain ATCC 25194 / DSM 2262 / NBRC 100088 / M29) TaxID=1242864 RepID=S9PEK0_CYSF2|nr:2OG-Fe(II) oxygenase [Cystobacter fuscus]EPX62820.1 2OG-Fe(II) oxygenase family enzyme [Cystobacter fuscus DSM 2262]
MTDFIEVHDDVLPPGLCQDIIKRFERSPHKHRGQTGGGVDLSKKDSYDLLLNAHPEYQEPLRLLLDRAFPPLRSYLTRYLYALVGAVSLSMKHPQTGQLMTITRESFSQLQGPVLDQLIGTVYRYGNLQVQKYLQGSGGYPHWHSEIFPKDASCEPLHRVLAFQFYLNDVSDGGETEFFYQEKKVQSKAGRMLIFPAGFTHTHRGNVPRSGDKYIITSWVLFHRAETLYGGGPPA